MHRKINKSSGFTLIELMAAIAIIGLLSSVALGSLTRARSKGHDARAIEDLKAIAKALDLHELDNTGFQTYPHILNSIYVPWHAVSWSSTTSAASWNELAGDLQVYIKLPYPPGYEYQYIRNNAWPVCLGAAESPGRYIRIGDMDTWVRLGYYLRARMDIPNQVSINDGGVLSGWYEIMGGFYSIHPSQASCMDY